jgi:hypothetical protein
LPEGNDSPSNLTFADLGSVRRWLFESLGNLGFVAIFPAINAKLIG